MKSMKPLKDLTLLDRFLFSEVMEDPRNLETVLEIILGREVLLRYLPQTEKEQRNSPLSRYIRLDVWGEDQEGNVYDVEVQKQDTRNLSRRSRFYQGMIDGKMLRPGEVDFNCLKDSYIIIITPFDPFGAGKYQYTFRMSCLEESGITLEDGALRIFLNTRGQNSEEVSPELAELLKFMEHTNQQPGEGYVSSRIQVLKKRIDDIKSSEEVGVKYMQEWEEREIEKREAHEEGRRQGWDAGHKEGLAAGERKKLREQVSRKLSKGKSAEMIAQELEEDEAVIRELIEEL